jgi:hypothetical protein
MNRSTARLLAFGVVSAIASLAPNAAGAQSSPTGLLSADPIRLEYVSQGFQVDTPIRWWTNDGVTTFHVTDSSTDRVLMVLVFPDLATAASERATLQAQEATGGAHLIPGYGISVWRQNVAFVESTVGDLNRQYVAEQKQSNRAMLGMADIAARANEATQPMYAVDSDLLSIVDRETANL